MARRSESRVQPAEGKLRQQDACFARGSSEFVPPVRWTVAVSPHILWESVLAGSVRRCDLPRGSQEKQLPLSSLMQYPLDIGEPRIS